MKKIGLFLIGIILLIIIEGGFQLKVRGIETKEISFTNDTSPIVKTVTVHEGDYHWWRGPDHNDIIPEGTTAPLKWGEDQNIRWQTPIPGTGHGTPILVENKIFLPTAEVGQDSQITVSIISLDRKTGEVLQKKTLRSGSKMKGMHGDNSYASATIACDGKRLFYPYTVGEHIFLDCCNLDLDLIWSKDLGEYHAMFGFCSSPVIYNDTVIFCVDRANEQSYLAAFEQETGKIRWKTNRSASDSSNASPGLIHSSGRDQAVINGPKTTISYDPGTGKKLWEVKGPADSCPSTPGWDEKKVYVSGGWPKKILLAISTDGSSREPVWTKSRPISPYVPSIICHDGLLYCLSDEAGLYCVDSNDGTLLWSEKFPVKFYSSPVLVGDRIYFFDRTGGGYVYQAGKTKIKLAENKLGVGVWATPVFADGGIYLRSLNTLYFIAEQE